MDTPHTDISAPMVINIPIKESNEALVSIDGHIDYGPPPESPLTRANYKLLREQVLVKLLKVEAGLPTGLKLRLYEGYRSPSFQQQLFIQHMQRVLSAEPKLNREQSYRKTALLVAPTETIDGKPLSPPHSTGGAVDIEIIDSKGKVLDFGMEVKDWHKVSNGLCCSNCADISLRAQNNRLLLASAMLKEGFVNYTREWWHFSYGDQYWAYSTEASHAVYGRIE
ncbi:M15 family metallopeptidase [Agarivorans sp. Alg241-V36]|uniref:M15 family metallopeptidase n=1 Tax=Agarivorans sp. Alg241-V36 TaxID=2305992 RepID=UPI0013D6193A|nr:M15 family metallopeptidase [Agarivorans sp. Alg241-V36]